MENTESKDVVIVGAGISGLVAGVRSAQMGKSVVILEKLKEDRYVCNSRLTGGVFHVALNDIRKPPEELVEAIMASTANTAVRELAELIAHKARDVVAWLQTMGIRFVRGADPWHSFVLAPPGIAALGRQWEGRAGDVLLRTMEERLKEFKGEIRREHEVKRLIIDGERCVGVEASTPSGLVTFRGSAVVLADGGFQANLAKIGQSITPAPDKIVQRNARTGFGDALRMATEVGATITALSGFYGHVLSRDALHNDTLWPYPWLDELLKYYIVVGPDGRRIADEGRGGVHVANVIAALAKPDSTTVICDEEGWQTAGKERFLPPNPNFEKAGATVIRADTLADLAKMAGLDKAGLLAQVDEYNKAIAAGSTESMVPGRTIKKYPARQIAKGPFYALPAASGITYTMGGVLIDAHARVQKNGAPSLAYMLLAVRLAALKGGLPGDMWVDW